MSVQQCDVVLVDFPFSGGGASKVRPAVVVQNDRDNLRLVNTIVVMITSRTSRASEPTQVFIDLATAEGKQSGLIMNSVVNCSDVFTLEQSKVLRMQGRLPQSTWSLLTKALSATFDLP